MLSCFFAEEFFRYTNSNEMQCLGFCPSSQYDVFRLNITMNIASFMQELGLPYKPNASLEGRVQRETMSVLPGPYKLYIY